MSRLLVEIWFNPIIFSGDYRASEIFGFDSAFIGLPIILMAFWIPIITFSNTKRVSRIDLRIVVMANNVLLLLFFFFYSKNGTIPLKVRNSENVRRFRKAQNTVLQFLVQF